MHHAAILLVDDEPAITHLVRELLRSDDALASAEILIANSAAEAMKVLAAHPIDLVVMDVNMPGTNGIEMLGKMRSAGYYPSAIALTGEVDGTVLAPLLTSGMEEFIVKPPDPEELCRKVRNALATGAAMPPIPGEPRASLMAQAKEENVPYSDVVLVHWSPQLVSSMQRLLPPGTIIEHLCGRENLLEAIGSRIAPIVAIDTKDERVDPDQLRELRSISPQSVFVGVVDRPSGRHDSAAAPTGFDGLLHNPLSLRTLRPWIESYFRPSGVEPL